MKPPLQITFPIIPLSYLKSIICQSIFCQENWDIKRPLLFSFNPWHTYLKLFYCYFLSLQNMNCKDCNKYSRCFAGCRTAAEQLRLSIESHDPFLKSWLFYIDAGFVVWKRFLSFLHIIWITWRDEITPEGKPPGGLTHMPESQKLSRPGTVLLISLNRLALSGVIIQVI